MSWNFFDSWKPKRVSERPIKCSQEEFEIQEKKCKKKYDNWQECVDGCGFNDPVCRDKLLPNYYKCTVKQNAMLTYLEDLDLHK